MRKSLYLKDDDYRLGFLYGNFVTLTNLTEDDWQRIEEQHLSPMYVSIHATDRALRAVLLGKPDVPDVLEQIRRFGELGIEVHTQIVALPGINDGAALHESIQQLAALLPDCADDRGCAGRPDQISLRRQAPADHPCRHPCPRDIRMDRYQLGAPAAVGREPCELTRQETESREA